MTPKSGIYKVQCWGASGADNAKELSGGRGGYTKGIIYLSKDIELYLFVGQSPDRNSRVGGWNGGGNGKYIIQDGNAGGGSTDIRLVNGAWNDFSSLKSRVMVAAGGGGSGKDINGVGGSSGGIYGYDGEDYSGWTTGDYYYTGAGASQISGGNTKNTTDYVSSDINSGLLINSGLNKGDLAMVEQTVILFMVVVVVVDIMEAVHLTEVMEGAVAVHRLYLDILAAMQSINHQYQQI